MSWWSKDNEENEEEDEMEDEGLYRTATDKIIFLVDARQSMIKSTTSSGDPCLLNVLRFVLEVMKSKIIASEAACIGLQFFGTREKDQDTNASSDNIYTLFSLSPPSAARIRQLQTLIDGFGNGSVDELFGSQDDSVRSVPLKQALWMCSQAFDIKATSTKAATDYHRIWLFTNDDDPYVHDSSEREKVLQVGKDCAQKGLEISVWYMNQTSPHKEFDLSLFYKPLLIASDVSLIAEEADDEGDKEMTTADESIAMRTMFAGDQGFDVNIANVRKKQFKKRILTRMLWTLGPKSNDVEFLGQNENQQSSEEDEKKDLALRHPLMAVRLYNLIHIMKRPVHTWLFAQTNEPVKVSSKFINGSTGESLDDTQIETFLETVHGMAFPITKDDYNNLKYNFAVKNFGYSKDNNVSMEVENNALNQKKSTNSNLENQIGIRTLFVTKASNLPEMNISSPYFVFPDESTIKGSMEMFSMLLDSLLVRSSVMIVNFQRTLTNASPPVHAAMIPIKNDELSGFYLLPLPQLEDVRALMNKSDDSNTETADDKTTIKSESSQQHPSVQVMKSIINKLQLDDSFDYTRDIDNPSIQLYYATLQAIALGETEVKYSLEHDDHMKPDQAALESVSDDLQRWKQIVGINDDDCDVSKKDNRKRSAASGDTAAGAAKKARAEAAAATTGDDIQGYKDLMNSNELSSQTVARLKEICAALALPVSGAKAVLVQRITEKLSSM